MNFCLDIPNAFTIVGQWLYNWQTLLSGLLALGAALWAGGKIQEQIRQADNLNNDELRRRRTSARVMLPFALSSIHAFCQSAGTNLAVAIEALGVEHQPTVQGNIDEVVVAPALGKIEYPSGAIDALGRFVECLDDNEQEKHIAELVGQLQIFHARYESESDKAVPFRVSLYNLLVDAGTVKFLVESIFNYARFADDASFAKVGTISNADAWKEIQKSTLGLIFDRPVIDGFAREIGSTIARYVEAGTSPWIEKFES